MPERRETSKTFSQIAWFVLVAFVCILPWGYPGAVSLLTHGMAGVFAALGPLVKFRCPKSEAAYPLDLITIPLGYFVATALLDRQIPNNTNLQLTACTLFFCFVLFSAFSFGARRTDDRKSLSQAERGK